VNHLTYRLLPEHGELQIDLSDGGALCFIGLEVTFRKKYYAILK
jgi:hypothetical protein